MSTYYDTLGVQPSATSKEIRKAYLRRARALHPDRQQGRSPADARRAEEAMRQINVAWDCLSNKDKRSAYDDRISSNGEASRSAQSPRSGYSSRSASQRPSNKQRPASAATPRKSGDAQAAASNGHAGRAHDSRPSIDDEPGDGSVSVLASLPVLIILGIGLGLLIVTAFGNQDGAIDNRERVPELDSQLRDSNCFTFLANGGVQQESCSSGRADAEVVAVVPDPGNCPADSESTTQGETVLCFVMLIPGSSVQAD